MNKLIRLCAMLLLPVTGLFAQAGANKAQLAGTVYDARQAVVPNAKVVLRNSATGFQRELTTNDAGTYRALLLDPGTYVVTAESAGFAQSTIEGVVLNVGSAVGLDITLQVQSTSTTVEVGETLLNVDIPAPTTTLNNLAITNLPINGRRFQDFAVLTPTVQVDPQRGQLSFAGQRGINANVMLDGGDYNQPFFGGIRGGERSNSIITIPQSAVQEFQVITTGYSAEYGRSTGGVLNTITKSGANDLHGDSFYQIRHKELGAKDPVLNIASAETLQQFGGSAGGAIRKDKWFWFGAYEHQLSSQPRQVLFAQLTGRTPTDATREAFTFLQGEQQRYTQTNNAYAFTGRTDYQTTKGNRLTLRYNFSDANAENAVSVGGALTPFTNRALSNDGTEKDRTHTGTAQYTHLFSPTVVNDLRFNGTFEERPRLSNSATPQVALSIVGTFGARNFLPTVQSDTRYQIADALSLIRGKHTLKIGFDFNRVNAAQVFGFNQFGGFAVAGSNVDTLLDILTIGGPVANRFDSRDVTYQRQIGNLAATLSMTQAAAFVQDSWKLTPKFTLDLGLRWEGQFNPSPDANNSALIDRVRNFRFPNGMTVDPTTIPDATRQVMPRIGFAWSPIQQGKRTVIRGHAGLFHASTPLLLFAGPQNNFRLPPGDVSITLSPTATQTVYQQLAAVGVDLNRSALNQLPVIPLETVQRASALALGGTARDPFLGAAVLAAASDFRNPRAFQMGLGSETELFRNFLVGAQLNYINTVYLQRNQDYNLPAPILRPTDRSQRPTFGLRSAGALATVRPIPQLAAVTVRASSARAMYRAVTVQAQYKTRKLQFGTFYTWAQNYSDDDTERDAGGFNYENPFNFRQDYSFARIDIRHQFTSYANYTLPLGFEISGTGRARSALPVNALTGADNNEDFGNNDRPFSAPGVIFPRNSFRNRAVTNFDMRVLKNFKLASETRRLQLSFEFFNLFNIDNVTFSGANGGLFGGTYGAGIDANGNAVPTDPRFLRLRLADGRYDPNNVQTGTPLQVQVGLRFFF